MGVQFALFALTLDEPIMLWARLKKTWV